MEQKQLDYRNILGDPMTRMEVMGRIEEDPEAFHIFQSLSETLQEELVAFCMGNWGLKLTYDPFFRYIFNPELKPERLSDFLSLLLGETVEVIEILPNESNRISETDSLLITDILVRLSSGAYANVEIQKVGYAFPGERCACYSADLLMRQLARTKNDLHKKGIKFSYKKIKKVYTIVLIEKSPASFWKHPKEYLHHSKQIFDTGLELDLLQEYFIIPLDVFKEIPHNNLNKLEAWLYFISSDSPKDIHQVIAEYPEFKELYGELLMLRYKVKELIHMYDIYREILREADEEAVQYMIEQQRKELEENKKELEDSKKELENNKQQLENSKQQLENSKQQLENSKQQLENSKQQLENSKQQLENSKQQLEAAQEKIELQQIQLSELYKEIEHLKTLLGK